MNVYLVVIGMKDPTNIAKQLLVCHLLNFGNIRCVSEHVCGFPIRSVCGDASLCVVLLRFGL